MRIISKFKDFYDSVSPYDTDPKRVYVRKTRELDAEDFPRLRNIISAMPYFEKGSSYRQPVGLVAFCGKAYPYYSFSRYGGVLGLTADRNKDVTYCYSFEAVVNYWKRVLKEAGASEGHSELCEAKDVLSKLDDPEAYYGTLSRYSSALSDDSWKSFQEKTNFEISDELFLKADSPILHMFVGGGTYHLEGNPRLNGLEFAKILEPYTAYQELEMFVGTNLVNQRDPDVHVPDVVKAKSHGFNKFSFRKDPSKKGKRRKARR